MGSHLFHKGDGSLNAILSTYGSPHLQARNGANDERDSKIPHFVLLRLCSKIPFGKGKGWFKNLPVIKLAKVIIDHHFGEYDAKELEIILMKRRQRQLQKRSQKDRQIALDQLR